MSESLRSITFKMRVIDCPYGGGRKRTEAYIVLRDADGTVAAEIPGMAFNKIPVSDLTALFGPVNAETEKRLVKLGFAKLTDSDPTVVLSLASPPLAAGLVVKAERVFLTHGFEKFFEFGKKQAKVKGHTTEDDFDDDGKRKHKP